MAIVIERQGGWSGHRAIGAADVLAVDVVDVVGLRDRHAAEIRRGGHLRPVLMAVRQRLKQEVPDRVRSAVPLDPAIRVFGSLDERLKVGVRTFHRSVQFVPGQIVRERSDRLASHEPGEMDLRIGEVRERDVDRPCGTRRRL